LTINESKFDKLWKKIIQAGGSSYKMNSESKCPPEAQVKDGTAASKVEVLKVTKTGGQISYN
jgi:hypothetical protein